MTTKVSSEFQVPERLLAATGMSREEVAQELALHFYREKKLSFGAARELAGMGIMEFRRFLSDREVVMDYGVEGLRDEIEGLRQYEAKFPSEGSKGK